MSESPQSAPPARRLPAEWEPQAAVLLSWPVPGAGWGAHYPAVRAAWLTLARHIQRFQPLLVNLPPALDDAAARAALARLDPARLTLVSVPTDDNWVRDFGPLTVYDDGQARWLDFRFDGWGGKFPAARDDAFTGRLAAALPDAPPVERSSLVLEGGAIDSDGAGTVLATRRCLLDPRRNPGLDAATLAAHLRASLGVRRILWLDNGWLAGDDTDGHIDMLARFCDRHTIAHVVCPDRADPHHAPLARLAAELAALRTADGRPYRLVPLPLPDPIHDEQGARLPASHANFLIVNGAVLVPVYDVPQDAAALAALAGAFPGRKIVPVPARAFIRQGGSVHCQTMHLPQRHAR